jgi:hypothetical protein
MSSSDPYGTPQPPISGQEPNVGWDLGQQTSPYRYPQQPSPYDYRQPAPDGPTGTSGYSFGPFGPDQQQPGWAHGTQPGPYGAPSGRHGPGPARRAPQPPKSNDKLLIIVGAAALAVILVAVIAVVVAFRTTPGASPQGGQSTGGQPDPSRSGVPQKAVRPSDAVAAYLQAVANGDATTALAYAADPAPTGPLLTNEVLAESQKRAPLTGIDVPVVDDQSAKSVSASYTLGSSAVSESFEVVKVADSWKIGHAVKDLDVSLILDGSVPVKINGVKVTEGSVAVLPGSYKFTTGLPYVSYGSKDVVLVKSPYAEADTYPIQSQLTKSGKKAAIAATKKSYSKCLSEHSLSPKNCPQKFNSKYNYKESTITWQQAGGEPLRKPEVSLSGTQARIEVPINLKLSGSCTYQGRSGNCSGTLTGKAIASMKVTTKRLKVKWVG